MFKEQFIKRWNTVGCFSSRELIFGLPVFATAAAGGVIEHTASISLAVLFLASLVYVRTWSSLWRQLNAGERVVLYCFGLYFVSAVLAYYNVNDEREYMKHLDRYFRFVLIVPVYLIVSKTGLKLFQYLLAGAVVSGPLYLGTAYFSLVDSTVINAKGSYHHITFGDMAMLSALFMTTVLMVSKLDNVIKVALTISIFCLLYASVLSQARGAWIALPVYLLFMLPLAVRHNKIKIRTILVSLIILSTLIVISPAGKIITERVQLAANEIDLFQSGEQPITSVGSRLAMWHIAFDVWKEHPVLGTGPGDFGLEIKAAQDKGMYHNLSLYSSTHNIFVQALVTTGAIGFVSLCMALFIVPFRLFYKASCESLNVASVSGMTMLIAFAVFGLTESWILRSPPVSIYLIYFVTLASTTMNGASE